MNPIKKITKGITSYLILSGIFLILFAVLILIYPEIIVYLIATLFVIIGLDTLYYGIIFKRSIKKEEKFWKKYFKEVERD
jgi:Flp pilus assembly protein TadB